MINMPSTFWMFDILSLSAVIAELIWCSCNVIINRIFVVHSSVGFLIGNVLFAHVFPPHTLSSSNPLFNTCSSLIIPSFPLFYNDVFVTFISFSSSFSYFPFWDPDLFGNSDNLIFASAVSTPNHILPEWYFLLFHSLLRAFPNKNIGIVVVMMLVIGLVQHDNGCSINPLLWLVWWLRESFY